MLHRLTPMPRAILLAEDNEDDVFFFQTAARKTGWPHELIVARDGREAIDHLQSIIASGSAAARLSLVLLDLKMPFVNGFEVLQWARNQPELRYVPIVVLTSSEQDSDIETAYRLGAASFLVKPAKPESMSELLRTLDAYWLRHNRLPAAPPERAPRTQSAVA